MVLHNVFEAEQGKPLPAAPHRRAVQLGASRQGGQRGDLILIGQAHEEVGRDTRVSPDSGVDVP